MEKIQYILTYFYTLIISIYTSTVFSFFGPKFRVGIQILTSFKFKTHLKPTLAEFYQIEFLQFDLDFKKFCLSGIIYFTISLFIEIIIFIEFANQLITLLWTSMDLFNSNKLEQTLSSQ